VKFNQDQSLLSNLSNITSHAKGSWIAQNKTRELIRDYGNSYDLKYFLFKNILKFFLKKIDINTLKQSKIIKNNFK
jgi:hypothetical protein